MDERTERLRARLSSFAVAVLKCLRGLPVDTATSGIVRQLARSAPSVAANYRAACCAQSRAEFISKLGVAVEEADETEHWLWMLRQLDASPAGALEAVYAEARQVRAILAASAGTARRNARDQPAPARRSVRSRGR